MNRKLCLLFVALCLAVAVVKSEPNIEVDENGNEYEVKRFNIQGRQLGSGRSQCVVSRRKRATAAVAREDDSDEIVADTAGSGLLFYSPPVEDAENNNEDDDYDDDYEDNKVDGEEKEEDDVTPIPDSGEDEEVDDTDEEDPETIEVVQVQQLPIIGQLQSEAEGVGVIVKGELSSSSATPSDDANQIMVVQANEPPNVNPDTHAVFELVPVGQQSNDKGIVIGDQGQIVHIYTAGHGAIGGDDEDDDFHYNEELSPISTTAIWSTGDDDNGDLYDELPPKRVKKPMAIKNKNRKVQQNKSKNKNRNENKRNKFKGQNRPLHNRNKNNRRLPVKKTQSSRRRPANKQRKSKPHKSLRRKTGSSNNDDPKNESYNKKTKDHSQKKNKNSSSKRSEVAKRRRNKNNVNIVDQGTNTYTRTMTMTQTGGPNDGGDVNCIYINKEPPPTTARPFWNILGRNANGAPIASGRYGNRKRANLRIYG